MQRDNTDDFAPGVKVMCIDLRHPILKYEQIYTIKRVSGLAVTLEEIPHREFLKTRFQIAYDFETPIPQDDTIPQNTEGTEVFTRRIAMNKPEPGRITEIVRSCSITTPFSCYIEKVDEEELWKALCSNSPASADVADIRARCEAANVLAQISAALHHLQADGTILRGDVADVLRQASTALQSALAENERLTELHASTVDEVRNMDFLWQEAKATVATLTAECERRRADEQHKETEMEQLLKALKPLAELPIGGEIIEDRDLILYGNAGKFITVGDVLDARAAIRACALQPALKSWPGPWFISMSDEKMMLTDVAEQAPTYDELLTMVKRLRSEREQWLRMAISVVLRQNWGPDAPIVAVAFDALVKLAGNKD